MECDYHKLWNDIRIRLMHLWHNHIICDQMALFYACDYEWQYAILLLFLHRIKMRSIQFVVNNSKSQISNNYNLGFISIAITILDDSINNVSDYHVFFPLERSSKLFSKQKPLFSLFSLTTMGRPFVLCDDFSHWQ